MVRHCLLLQRCYFITATVLEAADYVLPRLKLPTQHEADT